MKYIGPYEVKDVKAEGDWVVVTFSNDDKIMRLKKKMFDNLVTEKPEELTELRDRRIFGPMKAVMEVLLDWDIRSSDIDPLFQRINNFINDKLEYAATKHWQKMMANRLPEKWIPQDVFNERTIGDLDNILNVKISEGEVPTERDQTPSEGGGSDTSPEDKI